MNKPKNLCSYLKWRPHVGKVEISNLSSMIHSINIMKIGVTAQGHQRLDTQYIFTHRYFGLCVVYCILKMFNIFCKPLLNLR